MRPSDESAHGARATTVSSRVVGYDSARPEHRIAFRALNLAWIEAHFVVEERDRHELEDPEGSILATGGHIFMAEVVGPAGVEIVGTCALLAAHDGIFELAKMAVHPTARGHGIGRALGTAAISKARRLGARHVELLSNTALGPAIALYRTLGFVEAPLPATDYARANIRMILDLSAADE
jgi:GNAT superfamily N-acetyltransferase